MAILNYPNSDADRLAEDSLERLQVTWIEAVRSFAPHLGGLRDHLSGRLSDAHKARKADGPRLLRIVDDAVDRARPSCAPHTANALERQLRQAVYEHLLEVDAISSMGPAAILQLAPSPPPPAPPPPSDPPFWTGPRSMQAPERPPAELPSAPTAAAAAAAAPEVAPAARGSEGGSTAAGWRVREQTPAGNRQITSPPSELADASRRIGEWLHHKRYGEAAAQVQRICAEAGGQAAVDLAMDTGERCRARGKKLAATSCFIAALRADPTHEGALLRLAEICIDDSEVELAVSHLERIAQLSLLRGDPGHAVRMYRRIVTIAPQRDDILGLLMRTQAAVDNSNLHPRR